MIGDTPDSTVIVFPKEKIYHDFGTLVQDVMKKNWDIKRGIIILIGPDGKININGLCSKPEMIASGKALTSEGLH